MLPYLDVHGRRIWGPLAPHIFYGYSEERLHADIHAGENFPPVKWLIWSSQEIREKYFF